MDTDFVVDIWFGVVSANVTAINVLAKVVIFSIIKSTKREPKRYSGHKRNDVEHNSGYFHKLS